MTQWPPHEPPWTRDEVRASRNRPPHLRPRIPQPGEQVLFRERNWDDPVPATVISVQDMAVPADANGGDGIPDVNVWRHPDPEMPAASWAHPRVRRELVLTGDPHPRLRLRLQDGREMICREARVRGAPGWLPVSGGTGL